MKKGSNFQHAVFYFVGGLLVPPLKGVLSKKKMKKKKLCKLFCNTYKLALRGATIWFPWSARDLALGDHFVFFRHGGGITSSEPPLCCTLSSCWR